VPKLTYDELVELVVSIVLPSLHHASDRLPLNTVGFSEVAAAVIQIPVKDGRYQNLWDKFNWRNSRPKKPDRLRFLGAWWKTDSAGTNSLTQTIEVCREMTSMNF
jgi:hypothetical protein